MSRNGVTLIELLLALCIVGLLTAIAVPHLVPRLDAIAADTAARRLVAAHSRARMTAILQSRVVLLSIRADSLTTYVVSGADTVVVWREVGPVEDGVRLTGPTRRLTFSPVGLTLGVSNATFRLSRGGASLQVVISRLGRVRIARN